MNKFAPFIACVLVVTLLLDPVFGTAGRIIILETGMPQSQAIRTAFQEEAVVSGLTWIHTSLSTKTAWFWRQTVSSKYLQPIGGMWPAFMPFYRQVARIPVIGVFLGLGIMPIPVESGLVVIGDRIVISLLRLPYDYGLAHGIVMSFFILSWAGIHRWRAMPSPFSVKIMLAGAFFLQEASLVGIMLHPLSMSVLSNMVVAIFAAHALVQTPTGLMAFLENNTASIMPPPAFENTFLERLKILHQERIRPVSDIAGSIYVELIAAQHTRGVEDASEAQRQTAEYLNLSHIAVQEALALFFTLPPDKLLKSLMKTWTAARVVIKGLSFNFVPGRVPVLLKAAAAAIEIAGFPKAPRAPKPIELSLNSRIRALGYLSEALKISWLPLLPAAYTMGSTWPMKIAIFIGFLTLCFILAKLTRNRAQVLSLLLVRQFPIVLHPHDWKALRASLRLLPASATFPSTNRIHGDFILNMLREALIMFRQAAAENNADLLDNSLVHLEGWVRMYRSEHGNPSWDLIPKEIKLIFFIWMASTETKGEKEVQRLARIFHGFPSQIMAARRAA